MVKKIYNYIGIVFGQELVFIAW